MPELTEQINTETSRIFGEIDRLSKSLVLAGVHEYQDIYKWKVELSYNIALLYDKLSILTVIYNEIVAGLEKQGMTSAAAENSSKNSEVGRLILTMKNKIKGSEKILTHSRDLLKGLEEEKFNQY